MTDEQKHDHWSELANQVGAELPPAGGKEGGQSAAPDGARNESDAESTSIYDHVEVEISPRKVRSYRPKKGWDELAQEFDLPATARGGEKAFDALFEDQTPAGELAEAVAEVDFEEAVAAASREIESEAIGAENREKYRKKRKWRSDKSDSDKDYASKPSDDISDREQERADRKRDKRHRKGRSRRKKDSQQTIAEESMHEAEDVLDERTAEDAKRGGPQKDRGKSQEKEGGKRKGSEELQERKKMILHRGIPTWDEAMEYIIAANMEKRSKKDGGGSQSRSKGGRGGGRERTNSRKRSG